MLTVDDYAKIRLAHRDGMSIHDIARTFHHSRYKVRQILAHPEPTPYTRTRPPPAPVLGPFHAVIDAILAADEQAPPKQRHTAMQLYRRLRDEYAYQGGYGQVRRYVARHRRDHRETFIPLAHDPGQRLECDFGHIYVDFPDGRRPVPVLVTAWAYSNAPFAVALPTERTEAILAGTVLAFDFYGCVPREVWWDNPTTVVRALFKGRARRLHERYAALASHYTFEPLFCLPGRGNEKPRAENRVKDLQRQWATPVPSVPDREALNAHLVACCRRQAEHTVAGQHEPIGARFVRDKASALPLPARSFDACIFQAAQVDKYQTVQFDRNRYSVPRAHAFCAVTVKGYIDRVEVVAAGQVVARHGRSYGQDEQVLDPLHYLAALGRRPAALEHAPVLRDWQLPAAFAALRQALERQHGPRAGRRHYIRVLQLLGDHPAERVRRAVEGCLGQGGLTAERVRSAAERLAAAGGAAGTAAAAGAVPPLCQYQVPRPDLGRFDQLLSQGDSEDVR
jgi:transposase